MRRLIVVVVTAVALGGCGLGDLNRHTLPFAKGNGSDALTVTVELANAGNLVPNSEVKVDDVTVGSVRSISFKDWRAILEVGLDHGTTLPANATAAIGQKSLLGAAYLELDAPADATGTLADGASIGLDRTGRYPETEEVLAAISTVLNGGGLAQVETITTELNKALNGREGDVRDLVDELSTLAGTLDDQRQDIVDAMVQLNRVTADLRRQRATLTRALDTMPEAVKAVDDNADDLVRLLERMRDFSRVARTLETRSRADLQANLTSLVPILTQLNAAGDSLTGFLANPLIAFPTDGALRAVKGDYMNLFLTVDASIESISRDWFTGTPLESVSEIINGEPVPTTQKPAKAASPTTPTPAPSTAAPAPLPTPNPLKDLIDSLVGGLL